MKAKFLPITALVLLAVIVLSFPVRDLAADYYYRRVPGILEDKATEKGIASDTPRRHPGGPALPRIKED